MLPRVLFLILFALAFSFTNGTATVHADDNAAAPQEMETAASSIIPVHAVAMHGEPKYGADFTHLPYANPDAPKGGTLRMRAIGTFDSLNPFIAKGVPASSLGLIYQSLTEHSADEAFTEYGLIAKSIEMPEDRSYVTFNLHEEAKWHDGTPLTAHDVVWTFNTLIEKGAPFYKAYYSDVSSVHAENDNRVVFSFKETTNMELPLIIGQLTILPKHYWEGREFNETTLEPPLGSGPYKIASVDQGRKVVFERVKDWWAKDLPLNKGRYNFDSITIDYYRDQTVALQAFFSNEYDFIQENTAKTWATSYDDAEAIKNGKIIKEQISHEQPAGMQAFFMNLRKAVFQDIAVRKAVNLAFDFEWSNKQFAYDAYTRTDSYFENSELASSGLPQGAELEILEPFRAQLPPSVFTKEYKVPSTDGRGQNRRNLREAMKILDDAGYKIGEDGIRTHPETGARLSFEIIDNQPAFERWTLPFIQNLKRLGIEASFRVLDTAQYVNRLQAFDYDMTIHSIGQSLSPGNEQREYWHSEKVDVEGSRNLLGINDPVVDALIDLVISAPDRETLVTRTRALDRVLLHGHYVVPQWHINAWRVAYWDRFGKPDYAAKQSIGVTDTWWSKQEEQ